MVIHLLFMKKKWGHSEVQIHPSDIFFVVQCHVGQTNFNFIIYILDFKNEKPEAHIWSIV
jgi:nitrate reductase cytochrome c-type subunit